MQVRVQSSSGRFMLTLDDGTRFGQLKEEIYRKVNISPDRQVIKVGYPLHIVAGDDESMLEEVGISNASSLVLEELSISAVNSQDMNSKPEVFEKNDGNVTPNASFRKKQQVEYRQSDGTWIPAVIQDISYDEALEPYFTITISGDPNREKGTIGSRIRPFPTNPSRSSSNASQASSSDQATSTPTAPTVPPMNTSDVAITESLNVLLGMGFDAELARSCLEQSGGDLESAIDQCCQGMDSAEDPISSLQGQDVGTSIGSGGGLNDMTNGRNISTGSNQGGVVSAVDMKMTRHVVEADNSCLFTSLAYLLGSNDMSEDGRKLRKAVAESVEADHEVTPAMLDGKTVQEYSDWIMQDSSWGGELELKYLAMHVNSVIVVTDVQSLQRHAYGDHRTATQVLFVIYDGAHYDPLVLHGTIDGGNKEIKIFPVNKHCMHDASAKMYALCVEGGRIDPNLCALKYAQEAHDKRQFTDLKRDAMRCLVCQTSLKDQVHAIEHAKKTGHTNFQTL